MSSWCAVRNISLICDMAKSHSPRGNKAYELTASDGYGYKATFTPNLDGTVCIRSFQESLRPSVTVRRTLANRLELITPGF